MPISPYINFSGNCREAVAYYAEVFNTEPPNIMTYGEMPPDPSFAMPEEAKNLIMHTQLRIADSYVMFSDVFPGMFPDTDLVMGNAVSLTVVTKNRDEIVNAFNKLSEGGSVQMPLQETFWTKLYGNLRDKYGIEWQFSLDSGEMAG